MKMIQCSDLHLGAKMMEGLSEYQIAERSDELLKDFIAMTRYAVNNRIPVCMICGDLFDSSQPDPELVDKVREAITRAPRVNFYYLKGSSDKDFKGFDQDRPSNLFVFSNYWEYYTLGNGITIAGIEPDEENNMSYYYNLDLYEGLTNIVMLYGQIAALPGKDLVPTSLLRGKNISYLALGGLHTYMQDYLESGSAECYCGCLSGKNFEEDGTKGFVLLDIDDEGKITTSFIHDLTKRSYYNIMIDVTGTTSIIAIRNEIKRMTTSITADDLIRFTLIGEAGENTQIDPLYLKKQLEDSFYYVEIVNDTHLVLSDHVKFGQSAKDKFINGVRDSKLSKEDQDRIINIGLNAFNLNTAKKVEVRDKKNNFM